MPFQEKTNPSQEFSLRKIAGGLLIQEPDLLAHEVTKAKVVTKRKPTDAEVVSLSFAWRVVKQAKSNAIVFATEERTLGIGSGQTSRVDACKQAVLKMNELLTRDSKRATRDVLVVASDAFFPFRDGLDEAAKAQATAVIQPGGSLRDQEVIAAADEHGMAMIFTGMRHFRH